MKEKLKISTLCYVYTVWKLQNFTPTVFSQIFRQINVLLKDFTVNQFDEKKFAWQWFFRFSTLWLLNLDYFSGKHVVSFTNLRNFTFSTHIFYVKHDINAKDFIKAKVNVICIAVLKNLCVTVFHDCLILLFQDIGEYLQKVGHEFGVTTGRKRRCGWLDIPLLKYTSMVNGYSAVALTKLDILDDMDEIQIGVTYKKHGEPMEHFPSCEQVST